MNLLREFKNPYYRDVAMDITIVKTLVSYLLIRD